MCRFSSRPLHSSDAPYLESEIRILTRMLGRTIAIPSGYKAKKEFILTELARVIRADAWAWTLHDVQSFESPVLIDCMKGGFRDNRFALYHKFVSREFQGQEEQLLKGTFEGLYSFPDVWLGSNLILSVSVQSETRSTIAFFREQPADAFSEREIAISALLLTEVPWLHEQEFPLQVDPAARGLSRRLVQVLELLLNGHSRKEIGSLLGIQLNTVHGYVRSLYTRYGVNSHSALLQCLQSSPPRSW